MAKPYSTDLREGVVAAVEKAGMSRRQAALHFDVGISTVISWAGASGKPAAFCLAKWVGTSRRQLAASIVPFCWIGPGRKTLPCAGSWPNSPSAASRSTTGQCGILSAPRS